MHVLSRCSLILALVGAISSGCASRQGKQRTALLTMPYKEFDQTFGAGWRPLFDRGQYLEAALIIEQYPAWHPELTFGQQKFLHLHAGQLYALAGRNSRAIVHLDQAVSDRPAPELGPDWNDQASATRAFLAQDRASLMAARERLAAAGSTRLQGVDRLIEYLGSSYLEWYKWAPVCSNVTIPVGASREHRAAAEKLAKRIAASVNELTAGPAPSCIWVELREFAPRLAAGYIIIHTPDGTHITASNQYWLDAAVDRFLKSLRESGEHHLEAPFGLTTSFNLALAISEAR